MKKLIFLFAICFSFLSLTLSAQSDEKHKMENMRASVGATEFNNSRYIERVTKKNKEYIQGKKSSYKKNGTSISKKALAPYAEYSLKSKLAGGTYNVTVYYNIDKKTAPDEPIIIVGMDLLDSEEIRIKNKLVNSVRTSFRVKALRGKNHTLKIWLPSEGVAINKIEVGRALINKKN